MDDPGFRPRCASRRARSRSRDTARRGGPASGPIPPGMSGTDSPTTISRRTPNGLNRSTTTVARPKESTIASSQQGRRGLAWHGRRRVPTRASGRSATAHVGACRVTPAAAWGGRARMPACRISTAVCISTEAVIPATAGHEERQPGAIGNLGHDNQRSLVRTARHFGSSPASPVTHHTPSPSVSNAGRHLQTRSR